MPKRPDDSTLHAEQTLAAGWRFAHDEQVADQTTAWTPGEDALLNSDDTGRLPDCINWLKAGRCHGPAAADFDAGGWRKVRLPHDWTVEREPVREGEARNGFYRGGIGWYRRNLDLRHDPTRTVRLRFDGVFRDATVFLNGSLLAQNRGGYTDFECDLTPLLHADGDNQLVVRVDASGKEGWFYEGAGIYRDVTLIEAGTAQLVRGGLRVIPRPADDAVTKPVPVDVHAQCRNTTDTPINARVVHTLTDPDGKPIGAQTVDVTLPPGGTTDTHATFTVEQPQPWSVDQPKLYAVQTRLLVDDVTHDQVTTRTGLRTVRFDKDRGFFLNGEPMKLKGVCVHPDHAGVGSAVPAPLERWRLRRLKDMGTNAYRCSHNPPTATLLDACDELGMLVIDEVRCFGVSDEALLQLGRMVRRDRNHPSVILWSLGNEEMALQLTDVGRRIAERMRQVVRGLDTTRLVTVAVNDKWNTPTGVIEAEEVHGVNYLNLGSLEQLRANRPDLPVILSEEASALSTRGEYTNDPVAGVVAEYDVHDEFEGPHMSRWPFWGDTAESTWQTTVAHDYLGGIFVWTGFDYRGEQTPYVRWPSVGSHFGVMDMCGFDKDRTHYYRTWWKPDEPHVHVLPHWTWPG
ncbi:MAG: glycoside hydrolase family 2 TIM barrel-domain containing protein, partial [Planctomycetota bacterium]